MARVAQLHADRSALTIVVYVAVDEVKNIPTLVETHFKVGICSRVNMVLRPPFYIEHAVGGAPGHRSEDTAGSAVTGGCALGGQVVPVYQHGRTERSIGHYAVVVDPVGVLSDEL